MVKAMISKLILVVLVCLGKVEIRASESTDVTDSHRYDFHIGRFKFEVLKLGPGDFHTKIFVNEKSGSRKIIYSTQDYPAFMDDALKNSDPAAAIQHHFEQYQGQSIVLNFSTSDPHIISEMLLLNPQQNHVFVVPISNDDSILAALVRSHGPPNDRTLLGFLRIENPETLDFKILDIKDDGSYSWITGTGGKPFNLHQHSAVAEIDWEVKWQMQRVFKILTQEKPGLQIETSSDRARDIIVEPLLWLSDDVSEVPPSRENEFKPSPLRDHKVRYSAIHEGYTPVIAATRSRSPSGHIEVDLLVQHSKKETPPDSHALSRRIKDGVWISFGDAPEVYYLVESDIKGWILEKIKGSRSFVDDPEGKSFQLYFQLSPLKAAPMNNQLNYERIKTGQWVPKNLKSLLNGLRDKNPSLSSDRCKKSVRRLR